jgi:glycosyl hydrolase family 39 (putative alpha-L-iduronidase)
MSATFTCDLSGTTSLLKHAWEHTVGSSRALLALRADWQQQLERCHRELGFRHVRFHGLLNHDRGTLITHQDTLLYSFFNTNRNWDFLLSIGMRLFVEFGFMPETLASGSDVVFHFRGNVTPPKHYDEWATLIRKLVDHWIPGFYYHFLYMDTGRRAWESELSTIDSTFLLAGILTSAAYFDEDAPEEREIRSLAEELYARADWGWALNAGETVSMAWRPKSGFLQYRWEGYNEALILYVLARCGKWIAAPWKRLGRTSFR